GLPSRRCLCRQDSQRRETCRLAGHAAWQLVRKVPVKWPFLSPCAKNAGYRRVDRGRMCERPSLGHSVLVGPAVLVFQPPRHERANQLRHRGASALGDGFQHLSVVVIEPDDLVVPKRLTQPVLPPPIPRVLPTDGLCFSPCENPRTATL